MAGGRLSGRLGGWSPPPLLGSAWRPGRVVWFSRRRGVAASGSPAGLSRGLGAGLRPLGATLNGPGKATRFGLGDPLKLLNHGVEALNQPLARPPDPLRAAIELLNPSLRPALHVGHLPLGCCAHVLGLPRGRVRQLARLAFGGLAEIVGESLGGLAKLLCLALGGLPKLLRLVLGALTQVLGLALGGFAGLLGLPRGLRASLIGLPYALLQPVVGTGTGAGGDLLGGLVRALEDASGLIGDLLEGVPDRRLRRRSQAPHHYPRQLERGAVRAACAQPRRGRDFAVGSRRLPPRAA